MRATRMGTDARRDQIAQAVLAVVTAKGVSALSVAAVARRVGVTPSALYRHFDSKEHMLEATLERLGDRIHANVARARLGARGPLDALHRLLRLHVAMVREYRGFPVVMFSDFVLRVPGRRARMRGMMARFRAAIATLLREGQAAGEVRRDLAAEALAVQFFGLFVPATILWHMTAGRFDLTAQARHAWTIYHDGIRVPRVPAAPVRRRRAPRNQERSA